MEENFIVLWNKGANKRTPAAWKGFSKPKDRWKSYKRETEVILYYSLVLQCKSTLCGAPVFDFANMGTVSGDARRWFFITFPSVFRLRQRPSRHPGSRSSFVSSFIPQDYEIPFHVRIKTTPSMIYFVPFPLIFLV